MLFSEIEERSRKFKIALRTIIPLLIFIFLILYLLFFRIDSAKNLALIDYFVIVAITFVAVYFNFFLIDLGTKETLIDQTTQSFTHKAFLNRLQKFKPDTLIIIKISNLAELNRLYPIEKVDRLLSTIVRELDEHITLMCNKKPLIARSYGSEFLIATQECNINISRTLETFAKEHKNIDDLEVSFQFVALKLDQSFGPDQMIDKLRNILHKQPTLPKQKERYSIPSKASKLQEFEEEILFALKQRKFKFYFRPLLNAKTRQIDIFDMQSTLDLPHQIHSKVILSTINRLGKGIVYDLAICEELIAIMQKIDPHLSIIFNLSPFTLRNVTFQKEFFSLLQKSEIDPNRLIIQLYEKKAQHSLSSYLQTLQEYRDKGLRICIDNFGSNEASIGYMKHSAIDMVQFDKEFTKNLNDEKQLAILRSLVTLSKTLHVLTAAKWVDHPGQKRALEKLGIDYLQGFAIAEPIDTKTLLEKYAQG